ncbi:hypothetical protein [Novosphingobium sp. B 225]|uniref:hypothetical protein n=1 Tax=Novosphingobium sp. B 225 TaxID=1961849 RepID=UPI000B4AA27F|nr:hypothetical protein [Novosphingobium sp. B 225]
MILLRAVMGLTIVTSLALAAPLRAEPEITVTGQRLDREQARAQAVDYVSKLGIARGITPAARWIDPVCLKVLGVDAGIGGMVSARFQRIASRVGVRLARPGCRANAVIAFTPDAAGYVRDLERREPSAFDELGEVQLADMRGGNAPLRWWYRTGLRGADGDAVMAVPPLGFQITPEGGTSTGGGPTQDVFASKVSSLIATPGKRELKGAGVVVDVNLAQGKSLAAVGEFAALVLLAEIRPLADPPPGSILALFAPGATVPDELTTQDEAMLKALYAMPLAREARFHRGKLVDGMTRAVLGEAK